MDEKDGKDFQNVQVVSQIASIAQARRAVAFATMGRNYRSRVINTRHWSHQSIYECMQK